jgi:5-carboxymethyl-2-hydroxymuconate isomerase
VICNAAVQTGAFPLAGIRIRATACSHVVMADGNPDHASLDLSVRLRGGRSLETRKATTQTIFAAIEGYCAEIMSTFSLILSMEMRDIDPELSPKSSSMRDHLSQEFRRPTLPPISPSWTAILRGFAKAAS